MLAFDFHSDGKPSLTSAFDRFCTPQQLERKKPASTRFERIGLDLPFGRLIGLVGGPPEGRPVLAVHGWNSQAEFFLPMIQACVRQGLRVYAFDMPAHGQTRDANPDKPTSTLVEWVETLIALTQTLDIATWQGVIAHSFGGLATSFALGPRPWPGLPAMRARSLSLIAGAAGMPTVIDSYARALGTSPDDVQNIIDGVEAATRARLADVAIHAVASVLPENLLLVHDPADDTARLADLRAELAGHSPSAELLRPGAGHDGILFQLEVGRTVARFAADGVLA